MIGATRATTTLLAVALAGFLFWVGAKVVDPLSEGGLSAGDYWLWMGTLAAAGFVIALAQLLGGWTKWGWPRLSAPVFVGAFLPSLVVGLWILFFHQPDSSWLASHIREWSDDIGVDRLVSELGIVVPVIAFGLGLLFGLTFDTTGPTVAQEAVVEEAHQEPVGPLPPDAPRPDAEPVAVRDDGVPVEPDSVEPAVAEPEPPRATAPRDQ
ncbi:MAG: hypothetical protein ACXWYS_01250 [Gaiellaceae bacterium]